MNQIYINDNVLDYLDVSLEGFELYRKYNRSEIVSGLSKLCDEDHIKQYVNKVMYNRLMYLCPNDVYIYLNLPSTKLADENNVYFIYVLVINPIELKNKIHKALKLKDFW